MGSLGCPTSTWYQSPNPISPFSNQNHDLHPTPTFTINKQINLQTCHYSNTYPTRFANQSNPSPCLRDLQTNPSNPCIPRSPTRILHPKANSKAHYSPKTCDPNPCPTLRTTTRSKKKKKKKPKFFFQTDLSPHDD